MRTRLFACAAAAAIAFGAVAGVAGARARREHQPKPESFDGSCRFSGTVTFSPPMTALPQPIAQHAYASGTCSGRFTDRRGRAQELSSVPAAYRAESSGDQVSCAFGLASGTGALTLSGGAIAFAMSEYRGGATPLIRLTGAKSGQAWMAVTPSQSSDPAAAVQACSGPGLERFDLDAQMQTVGAISG